MTTCTDELLFVGRYFPVFWYGMEWRVEKKALGLHAPMDPRVRLALVNEKKQKCSPLARFGGVNRTSSKETRLWVLAITNCGFCDVCRGKPIVGHACESVI